MGTAPAAKRLQGTAPGGSDRQRGHRLGRRGYRTVAVGGQHRPTDATGGHRPRRRCVPGRARHPVATHDRTRAPARHPDQPQQPERPLRHPAVPGAGGPALGLRSGGHRHHPAPPSLPSRLPVEAPRGARVRLVGPDHPSRRRAHPPGGRRTALPAVGVGRPAVTGTGHRPAVPGGRSGRRQDVPRRAHPSRLADLPARHRRPLRRAHRGRALRPRRHAALPDLGHGARPGRGRQRPGGADPAWPNCGPPPFTTIPVERR